MGAAWEIACILGEMCYTCGIEYEFGRNLYDTEQTPGTAETCDRNR